MSDINKKPISAPSVTMIGGHPVWCTRPRDMARTHDHVSAPITVEGEAPITVEVVMSCEDEVPRVSILPPGDGEMASMEAAQALAVAGVLEKTAATNARDFIAMTRVGESVNVDGDPGPKVNAGHLTCAISP